MLEPGYLSDARERLDEGRRRWSAQGSANYDYEFQRICFCGTELTSRAVVRVRSGRVAGATLVETGQTVGGAELDRYYTVEGLFRLIQDAIDRDAAEVTVVYHTELGYPVSARFDYMKNAIDEELQFSASGLRRLQ